MINIKIDKVLENKEKSLYWLAQVTGLTYPTIHNLVRGNTKSISFDTLGKICIALECNISDILELNKP